MGSKSHHKILIWMIILSMCLHQSRTSEIVPQSTTDTDAVEKSPPPTSTSISISTDDVVEQTKLSTDTNSDLENAETKDPQKHEIIKQIRKVNNDGSYTVGYEADDGTFKIESRDVLGNVKGTFGYVDSNGEIKRVSYTGNNGTTGLRNYPGNLSKEDITTSVTNGRSNKTYTASSTTRRPASLAYLSSTSSPNSPTSQRPSSVIQTIPRRRILAPSSTERSQYNHYATSKLPEATTTSPSANMEHTTTVVYATSVPSSSKPIIVIRPTVLSSSTTKTPEQITRPDKLEIDHVSKVLITKSREVPTIKPVTEHVNEKEQDKKSIRGNNLRRQLAQDKEDHYEAQQQILYSQAAGEDASHIYAGMSGNVRPLFTTTSTPRVPAVVLAARQRAAHLQSIINNSAPTTTTERVYVRPPKRGEAISVSYEPTTEPSTESNYLTQNPNPVVQIPANQAIPQATDEDRRLYRQRPVPVNYRTRELRQQPPQPAGTEPPRGFYRVPQGRSPPPSQPPEQYIRETTQIPERNEDSIQGQGYASGEEQNLALNYRRQRRPPFPPQFTDGSNDIGYDQQSFPIPFTQNPYRAPYQPQQYYDYPERPLTTRDFERLLQLLVIRHQQLQQQYNRFGSPFSQINPYFQGIGYSPYYNNPYQSYQQIPRPPLYDPSAFDPRYSPYRSQIPNPLQPFDNGENAYQAQSPVGASDNPASYDGQRLIPRKKQYNQRYFGTPVPGYSSAPQPDYSQQLGPQSVPSDYLPPDVREELLYRMLMLAIQSEQQATNIPAASNPEVKTATPTATFKKPVRSVQILGEE